MSQILPLYIVDAFTAYNNESFTGNPAAVCILKYDDDITDDIKQKIASEMNLSETAFVAEDWTQNGQNDDSMTYTLRWFTPKAEIELCGHATLATATVLFERLKQSRNQTQGVCNQIKFETLYKGFLEAKTDSNLNSISLNFPLNDCKLINRNENLWIEDLVNKTLGPQLGIDYTQDIQYSLVTKKLLIRLRDASESENFIYKVSPNFDQMLKIDTNDSVRGVIVTQKASKTDGLHFLSRYFAPWVGINEDPVTGAAHTVLVPYWKRQYDSYGIETNGQLIGKQCSSRSGIVNSRIVGDRVELTGSSKIILNGNLAL